MKDFIGWIKAICLILRYGREGAINFLVKKQSEVFQEQVALEKGSFRLKLKREKLETDHNKNIANLKKELLVALKQSEENDAIREKYFGHNPEITDKRKQKRKDIWEKHFGKNGTYK